MDIRQSNSLQSRRCHNTFTKKCKIEGVSVYIMHGRLRAGIYERLLIETRWVSVERGQM